MGWTITITRTDLGRRVMQEIDDGVREGVWLITLEKLIELKLASGLSAPHRLKDLADVQELIARLKLPLDLAENLDTSVRDEYRRLWQNVQSITPEE